LANAPFNHLFIFCQICAEVHSLENNVIDVFNSEPKYCH